MDLASRRRAGVAAAGLATFVNLYATQAILPTLAADGLRELGVRVADVRVPEARGAVEEALPVGGEDIGALAAVDHELPPEDGRHVRLR